MQHMQLLEPIIAQNKLHMTRIAYNNMYVDNIYAMNLFFIHLHCSTKVAHGDTCAFVKFNYMVTHGI
jgi:hypothetical protein